MANAHSFPLLRLPNLAREHVVLVMDIREQYLFATLSKKSKIVARIGVRRLSYDFDLMLAPDYIFVEIHKAGRKNRLAIRILPTHITDFFNQHDIQLKVEHIMETLMEQLTLLIDIFKISIFKIETRCIANDSIKQFLTKVKGLNIGIDELKVEVVKWDNEMFQWVMENCRDLKKLENFFGTTPDFQWDSKKPFTFEYLFLFNAPWLSLDHLTRLFMNCRYFEIYLDEHQLTADDLNQFIKVWMNESRMEFVKIYMGVTPDFHRIMQDIDKVPVQEACIENHFYLFGAGEAYKIRQQSGKEAVVCVLSGLYFIMTIHFDNPRCDFWPVSDNEKEYEEEESEEETDEDLEDEDEVENAEDQDDEQLEEDGF